LRKFHLLHLVTRWQEAFTSSWPASEHITLWGPTSDQMLSTRLKRRQEQVDYWQIRDGDDDSSGNGSEVSQSDDVDPGLIEQLDTFNLVDSQYEDTVDFE
jgi:hypothetical protein